MKDKEVKLEETQASHTVMGIHGIRGISKGYFGGLDSLVLYLRYHIVAFPSIARQTHMCRHVLFIRLLFHVYHVVGFCCLSVILYNCVLIEI